MKYVLVQDYKLPNKRVVFDSDEESDGYEPLEEMVTSDGNAGHAEDRSEDKDQGSSKQVCLIWHAIP